MATKYNPLPVDSFPDEVRPAIARLNFQLRDLFGLEGTLTSPLTARRSDRTIARKSIQLVDQTKVVNITSVTNVDRLAALGAAPAKVQFRVLAGPPDGLYVSMQATGGTWKWWPIVDAV